jgi:CheY-like chemotaxis protein/HPt (histidine-containing phosphotransfer) domain-containing protein
VANELQTPPSANAPILDLLLAEDNKINQQFAVALLNKAGHHVDVVDNGHKAVDAVRHAAYDAVLMDIQMPELGGIDATAQIRALPSPACDVYIIAMTANAMSGAEQEYLAAGMNDYISKPVDSRLLFSKLARIIPKSRSAQTASISLVPRTASVAPSTEPKADFPAPPVDREKLETLQSVLPFSKIEDLITLFLAEVDGHMMRIATYNTDGDFEKLAREAHIIVSTAGNLGAMQMSALARSLEQECKQSQIHLIPGLIEEMSSASETMVLALNEWLAAQRPGNAQMQAAGR